MIDFEAARRAMVDGQVRPADVTRLAIIQAMLATPRERFVPRAHRAVAYADMAIPLAPGRALLDARSFAKMLDAAEIRPTDLVLDVGAGYGYSAVVISRLAAAVVALEEEPVLVAASREAMAGVGADNVLFEEGRLAEGSPRSGPYDAIVVEGAVAGPPRALLEQLREGGRLVAIVQDGPLGKATVFMRSGGTTSSRRAFDASAPVLPGFDSAPAFEF
ncbi:protein-L-isoaspartate O-methyltransferase family protein [Rubrimonas cliftonensis]|uniref:Protein-L-isoaspartate O-methyltransferase n=1 Tax=Rubrimonas cliftonensis TaxID=89524 RepID=A0A1H3W3T2_9RHOB|nr:protein-L-isoaspartate O-methyltransferase [Rubrimonas cliftonensis]SDZ81743.1 protein-L-isoaspartate(D-aspartate) O-methyltransferase [Rubrimonas cliftonensis]